jgi:hypothetical protein
MVRALLRCAVRFADRRLACAVATVLACLFFGTADAHASDYDDALAEYATFRKASNQTDREVAQFRLAVTLRRLRFYEGAFGLFSEIADKPSHARFAETLPWLERLATDLPPPADVVERVGKYDEKTIDDVSGKDVALRAHTLYLLGRYRDRNRQEDEAIRLWAKVGRASRWHCKAQFLTGVADVKLRRAAPAVQAFQRVIAAIDDGVDCEGDVESLRSLANLSIARVYYSSAVGTDKLGGLVTDPAKLTTALKYWDAVDPTSEHWLDSVFERSWAYFMLGDHSRALGNLHVVRSAFFERTWWKPEVDVLRATTYLASCQYDDVGAITARFDETYRPIGQELTKLVASLDEQDDRAYQLLRDLRDGRAKVSPGVRRVLEHALSDRELLQHLQYVSLLDDELKRLGKAPASFVGSPLGDDLKDASVLARDIAIRNTANATRDRVARALGDLVEELGSNARLLHAAVLGRQGGLDETSIPARVPSADADRNVVQGDDEHVIWPFTGEYWSDEVGTYRQSIHSLCR